RSRKDRLLVVEPSNNDVIAWGKVNQRMEPAVAARLHDRVCAHLQGRELFVFDGGACTDPKHRLNVRVIADKAWHALFAHCLLIRFSATKNASYRPDLTILCAADLNADPQSDGTRSETFINVYLDRGLVIIGGTHYAGEIKKSVFSYLNYLLPKRGVFPMHCSANIGDDGRT